jgi:transcriptional regulator with XRE-family HTH domain
MMDLDRQERFIELRSKGITMDKIATELGVCRRTLITWSRKLQFQIRNERAIELERLQHQCLSSPEDRALAAAAELRRIRQELNNRDLTKLSTGRLYSLADSMERRVLQCTGKPRFTTPAHEVPIDERVTKTEDWSA